MVYFTTSEVKFHVKIWLINAGVCWQKTERELESVQISKSAAQIAFL